MSQPATAREEWATGWPVVFAAAVGASMVSIAIGSLGAFMEPLEQSMGWKRAEISAGLTLYAIFGIICGPILGTLVDRYGPRRIALPGVLLCGAGFALFGTVTNSVLHWIALWVVFSLCAQVPRPMIWATAVTSVFKKSRGFALGVMLAGMGVGGIVAPILSFQLIAEFDWRLAYVIMGLGWGGVAWIACYFFFYGASDRLRTAPPVAGTPAKVELPGMTAREGLRSPAFAKIAFATFFSNTLLVGVVVHQIPLLSATGLGRGEAVWLVGLAGIGSMAGKLVCGWLADRVPGNLLAAFFVALPMLPCYLYLSHSTSPMERLVPVLALSIAGGAQTHMLTYLTSRYFGLRAYGTIFGFVASVMAIGIGLGPLLAGFVFDHTQSYEWVMLASFPMSIIGALLLLSLGRYPDQPEPAGTPRAKPATAS